jgi:hypothetical protein
MGRASKKNTFYDKRTHFEKQKNEHKPINNNQLHKLAPDRPKKNKPIFACRGEASSEAGPDPPKPVPSKLKRRRMAKGGTAIGFYLNFKGSKAKLVLV